MQRYVTSGDGDGAVAPSSSEDTDGERRRMRATLVRFGEAQYEEVKDEARLAGVSVAEFVRQAVAVWVFHNAQRREYSRNGDGDGAGPD